MSCGLFGLGCSLTLLWSLVLGCVLDFSPRYLHGVQSGSWYFLAQIALTDLTDESLVPGLLLSAPAHFLPSVMHDSGRVVGFCVREIAQVISARWTEGSPSQSAGRVTPSLAVFQLSCCES